MNPMLSESSETWPGAHTRHNTVHGFSSCVNQTMQAAHQAAERVLKRHHQSRVAMLRFGMGSCGSPWVMDTQTPGYPYVGNREITPDRTNSVTPGIRGGYYWNQAVLRSQKRATAGLALTGPAARCLLGSHEGCAIVVRHKSLVVGCACVIGLLGHGFSPARERICPMVTKTASLSSRPHGYILFCTGTAIGLSLSPPLAWRILQHM